MDWLPTLLLILGSLFILLLTGLPVAFCFIFINLVGACILLGGSAGLHQIAFSAWKSVASFSLLPVPMFVLMGELMFLTGLGGNLIDASGRLLGRVPGRLSLIAILSGTFFATMSGSTIGTTALLGDVLVPEMEKRGYKKPMSLGPVMGGGGLAMIIPPSTLGVVLAATAEISIGKTLIAGVIPGLVMAVLYAGYIIGRCWLQPEIAPSYEIEYTPLTEKIIRAVKHILPLGLVFFLAVGLIFIGFATPSEAAAMGVLGCIVLAACYGKLNWKVITKSVTSTIRISVMALLILSAATTFGQLMVISGASAGLVQYITSLQVTPIIIVICMQLVVLFLGLFISAMAIIMIAVPIFMPIINSLGLDPIWFALMTLVNLNTGSITPPFGMDLFVMKAVAPPGNTMADIVKAAFPFVVCNIIAILLIMFFPPIVMWLPNLMH